MSCTIRATRVRRHAHTNQSEALTDVSICGGGPRPRRRHSTEKDYISDYGRIVVRIWPIRTCEYQKAHVEQCGVFDYKVVMRDTYR